MIPIALHEKVVQNSFYKIQKEGLRNVAITSARRHEGVSALSYALARRAAAAGIRVLLIDLNFTHQGQSESLALEHHDWSPSMQVEHIQVQSISNTNLSVLSTPQKVRDTWPFQNRDTVRDMLTRFDAQYDLVIADMPSILEPESDLQAEIVCAAFDATLITALSGRATETEMMKLKTILDEANVSILGVVMNDQFTPTLAEELKRQLDKTADRFPKITEKLRRWIDHNAFLGQSL